MTSKLFVCLVASLYVISSVQAQSTTCPENEEAVECLPGCNDSCDNYNKPCAVKVKCPNPGCVCKPNYARNEKNVCVPWIECPGAKCGKNEIKTMFMPPLGCQPSCQNPTAGHTCRFIPQPGCVCRENYIRNGEKCVPKKCCTKSKGCGKATSDDAIVF